MKKISYLCSYLHFELNKMGQTTKRILFVNSEMSPFVPDSKISTICRNLPQGIQEKRREIRSFMPKYGCINERKNQLHEVIRLSGMNMIISDVDRPLVIKVASISAARLQVYFIDNEDYFKRKQIDRNEDGNFFEDNDERAIFFARGILETVKKLRWAPDIIHCQGWISQLVPIYLKKTYKDDPIFSSSKVVLSLYNDIPGERFSPEFADKLVAGGITASDVSLLKEANGTNLAKLAASYSDAVIMGDPDIDPELQGFCASLGLPVLPYNAAAAADGSYIDEYDSFYDQL